MKCHENLIYGNVLATKCSYHCNIFGVLYKAQKQQVGESFFTKAPIKMLSILVINTFLIVPGAFATIYMEGRCPGYTAVPGFNRNQFLGDWYEIKRLEADELLNADCVLVNYKTNVDGSTVDVSNRMVVLGNTPSRIEQRGYARYLDTSGRLVMIYNETDPSARLFDYYVTHTDYQTYMVAVSCENVNNSHYGESAWVMSRTRILPTTAVAVVNQATQQWSAGFFRTTNQDEVLCSSSRQLVLASITLLMGLVTIHFLR
ncbi:apolipoprotein D-like isoform X2 [Lutzomyia longipalpis]|uniref:apolipoprotein D-like isoform X2 n=1 Tax=Lutzomyia longipalpis TaxID=7200 RepID=UPI0024837C76|nr:apolipoprotein D-like isoform X2 [Lutzomyia longipalpis]